MEDAEAVVIETGLDIGGHPLVEELTVLWKLSAVTDLGGGKALQTRIRMVS